MVEANLPQKPEAIPGFESVNRYWDPRSAAWMAKILPGEFYVSRGGEVITTVLGSCIAVCMHDPVLGIAGMNHFMLPEKDVLTVQDVERGVKTMSRYGNWAIEYLLNQLLKMGSRKERIEVKLFGGSSVLARHTSVGQRNTCFAEDYFVREKISVVASDVGGSYPRKIRYFPETGKVLVRRLVDHGYQNLIDRERHYLEELDMHKAAPIELFEKRVEPND